LYLDDSGGKMLKAIAATIGALSIAFGLGGTALAAPLHSAGSTAKLAHHHRRHHRRHRHSGIPQHNGGDHDSDNNGGPSDGDGNL
jgi:hypothetical protein